LSSLAEAERVRLKSFSHPLVLITFLCWLKFPDYFKQAKKFSIYFEQKEEVALLQLIYMDFLRHEQESLNNY